MEGPAMKISARNSIKGKIVEIKTGVVNSEVVLDIGGTKIVSIITKDAVESLKLKVGDTAYAVIKASNVMIAVD
jgi:molybdopterin-binding protein